MNRRNFFQVFAAVLLGGTVSSKPTEQYTWDLADAEDRFVAEQRRLEDAAIADYDRHWGQMREEMIAAQVREELIAALNQL